jgi:hypothetical protein
MQRVMAKESPLFVSESVATVLLPALFLKKALCLLLLFFFIPRGQMLG